MTRVLVTGSREWTDWRWIQAVLEALPKDHEGPFTIVHGGARGADRDAARIAEGLGYSTEEHLADWDEYGKRAGLIRNAQMVASDIDVCLAFIKDRSRGATHCADLAEKSGIETRRFLA